MDIQSYILGYQKGKAASGGGGASSVKVLLEPMTIGVFEDTGSVHPTKSEALYEFTTEQAPVSIEKGKTYIVDWDGTQHTVICKEITVEGASTRILYIGDGSILYAMGVPAESGDPAKPFVVMQAIGTNSDTGESMNIVSFVAPSTAVTHNFGLSIVMNQGGGTSGGGSLPAGVYWKPFEISAPNNFSQQWFTFNGELYAFTGEVTGSGPMRYLYKWDGTSWATISSNVNGLGLTYTQGYAQMFEYNGKLHIIGTDSKKHHVFNGTSITARSEMPSSVGTDGMFVQDGLLKIFSYSNSKVYVWDESADTWTEEATLGGGGYDYKYFYAFGNKIMVLSALTDIYIYENNTLTTVGKRPKYNNNRAFIYDGYLYIYDGSKVTSSTARNTGIISRINPETYEEETVCWSPDGAEGSSRARFFNYNGLLHLIQYSPTDSFCANVFYEVKSE